MSTPARLAAGLLALATVLPASGQEALLGSAGHVVIPQARSFALAPNATALGIEGVEARVRIREQTARTSFDVTLTNPTARQQEAVLLLPVPDGAVVSGFTFEGAGRDSAAEILPRDEARRLYDDIVRRLLDPALVEFAGANLVRSSVFPVPAGGTQRVRLTYEHLLPGDGDRIDYVLPRSESLDGTIPWRIDVDLRAEHPISTVYSPSHDVTATRTGPGSYAITLAAGAGLEPGPFRLSYLLDRGGVSATMFAYPDAEVGGGYFLLMAGLPAPTSAGAPTVRREVTVVLDRSGSMAGVKMDQVREAALQVIEGLADGESFNIIDYATTVASFAPAPVVKDRRQTLAARDYLAAIRPAGGTNIHDALATALQQDATPDALPIVLFLTDGLPTIGRTSEVTIRTMVESSNPHGRRVFTIGVGADVNAPLLDRVAEGTRATAAYVLPGADVEVEVARVFRRLYGPILAGPVLTTTDTSGAVSTRLVRDVVPAALPDLFDGDQLILLGTYRGDDPITFRIAGEYLGAPREFSFTFAMTEATTFNAFVPRLWASRRIGVLVDAIRQAGAASAEQPAVRGGPVSADPAHGELVDEILRLSTRFGILTEYTAFLATDGTDLSDWNELRTGCSGALERRAVMTRSGPSALNQALNVAAWTGQATLNYRNRFVDERLRRVETTGVQQVGDLAFFQRDGRWIDSRLAPSMPIEPHEVITVGSEPWLELGRRLARQGRPGALALAGEILLLVDGRVILVTDGC